MRKTRAGVDIGWNGRGKSREKTSISFDECRRLRPDRPFPASRVSSRLLLRSSRWLPPVPLVAIKDLFGKVYEYEEDLYLSLDGSAELIVNASIPSLVNLRGLDLPLDQAAQLDRDAIRSAYTSPVAEVTRVSRPWRRQGRRFVQIRLRVNDIRRLTEAAPFSWSAYELAEKDGLVVYRQTVGKSAMRPASLTKVGWTGGELVAFKLHLPSKIVWHNARELETNEPSDIARETS